jgi:capsular exopolysaccharide synthesis family protein
MGAEEAALNAELENLSVITAGATPPNPGELISSPKMDDILNCLMSRADIVILDGPPVLVTDATVLASKVDAVLLVVGANRTRRSEAMVALKQLERARAHVIGAVLNRVTDTRSSYYRLYQYDYGLEKPAPHRSLRIGKWSIPLPEFRLPRRAPGEKRASELEHPEPVADKT